MSAKAMVALRCARRTERQVFTRPSRRATVRQRALPTTSSRLLGVLSTGFRYPTTSTISAETLRKAVTVP